MPLLLLSKPDGASGTSGTADDRAKHKTATTMKILMGSPPWGGLGAGLSSWIPLRPPAAKGKNQGGCPNQHVRQVCGRCRRLSHGFRHSLVHASGPTILRSGRQPFLSFIRLLLSLYTPARAKCAPE